MQETYQIVSKIQRYDPDNDRSWIQNYQLETGRILQFTDLFRKINKELDPTLAWNSSCEHGQCGTCSVKINGKPMLACELLVENAVVHFETTEFLIEPLTIAPVVRDLIVDFDKAYERVHKIKPYIIEPVANPNSGNEYKIAPGHLQRYVDATRCINCFCCATACISSHHNFLGPNAIMASVVRLMDLREQAKDERKTLLYSEEGVYRCHTSRACSFVCPKEIDVAHFIALAKSGALESDA
ncbi:MAG: succinate dehydrogenase/fumarate reductase iron-sulfur subunit [Desulfobacterales bacterium]|nr:MAG: succinate dehydrogenase/fumarate reductase iron-sulfur subunit [Desulfobacterales bacterium]